MSVRRIGSNEVDCRCISVATPSSCLTIDRNMIGITCSKAFVNPAANACLELRYIDPSENPRVGGFAQPSPSGETEEVEELTTSLFAVLDDCLVAGHAREHGNDSHRKKGRERVSLTLGAAWILNAFKEFQQRWLGIHA